MNPYLIIAALVACLGAGWGGFTLGVDHQKASESDKKELLEEAVGILSDASAKAIAKIRVNNTTIKQEVERETHTNTIYADCKHSDNGLRLVNSALTNSEPKPADGGKLPPPDTPAR